MEDVILKWKALVKRRKYIIVCRNEEAVVDANAPQQSAVSPLIIALSSYAAGQWSMARLRLLDAFSMSD